MWNELYIVLFFIQRMLHSISSKSIVLPYGKYRGWPTPLPPDLPPDLGSAHPFGRPKIDQKSIKNLINFRSRFWTDFGSFWDPNLASFSAKFRPQTVLGPVSHRKRRFPRNSTKTNRKSIKMPPGHPPKRSQIDPSRSQEATFSLLNFDLVFGSILVSFWLPKCLPLGTLFGAKIDQITYASETPTV